MIARPHGWRRPTLVGGIALTLALTACGGGGEDDASADAPSPDATVTVTPRVAEPGETHDHGLSVGDGTSAAAGGYEMVDLTLPEYSGSPGDVTFRILDSTGEPVVDYQEQQTQLLHLYVVRQDLQDFRHVHPTLAEDGTWSARVNLAGSGSYRVIAEFVPGSSTTGGHVVLGRSEVVPGGWTPQQVTATSSGTDDVVEVTASEEVETGPDGRLELRITSATDDTVPQLDTYLGTYAHATGFDLDSGRVSHVHPVGEPETDGDAAVLSLHTDFDERGPRLFFVQVRVGGFVHTVPVSTTVV